MLSLHYVSFLVCGFESDTEFVDFYDSGESSEEFIFYKMAKSNISQTYFFILVFTISRTTGWISMFLKKLQINVLSDTSALGFCEREPFLAFSHI